MFSSKVIRTISDTTYVLLLLTSVGAIGISCAALLSQAVRTSPTQSWSSDINALVIGASYIIVVGEHFIPRISDLVSSYFSLYHPPSSVRIVESKSGGDYREFPGDIEGYVVVTFRK
jgi:hypothetical protein